MTKKKRIIIICSCLAMLGLMVYVLLNAHNASYYECVDYEDFDSVKADFDGIAELAYEHGYGIYSIVTGRKMSKMAEPTFIDILISDADMERIDRIISYSYSNTFNKRSLDTIRVQNGSVSFEYMDGIGCGIVKTADIKRFIKDHDMYGDMDYKKLANNWYSYFR